MATIIDSYSETNRSVDELVDAAAVNNSAIGQTFTGTGSVVGSCKFYLKKNGTPTGNAVAQIYPMIQTFGTDGVPGPTLAAPVALATSDNLAVSTLTTTQTLTSLTFSGANQITLTNGTHYCVSFEYSSGSSGNSVVIAKDDTSPTHAGNGFYKDSSVTPGYTTSGFTGDICFYVYDNTGAVNSSNFMAFV